MDIFTCTMFLYIYKKTNSHPLLLFFGIFLYGQVHGVCGAGLNICKTSECIFGAVVMVYCSRLFILQDALWKKIMYCF